MIAAVIGFGILVFIHEFGHFISAVLFGVKVEKFSIGMGPAIAGFRFRGTFFQIGLIPFGGFCQFKEDALLDDIPSLIEYDDFNKMLAEIPLDERDFVLNNFELVLPDSLEKADWEQVEKEFLENNLNDIYTFNEATLKYSLNNENPEMNKISALKILSDFSSSLLMYRVKKDITDADKEKTVKLMYKNYNVQKLRNKDSFFGVIPWKRLVIAFSGPFMNYILAVVFLAFAFSISYTERFIPNRIILSDDVGGNVSAAGKGGLKTGDIITAIDDVEIDSFQALSENMIMTTGKNSVKVTVNRDGEIIDFNVMPDWDKANLKPLLGVLYYNEPVIDYSEDNYILNELGLKDGDMIVSINGNRDVVTTITVNRFFQDNFKTLNKGFFEILRNNDEIIVELDFMKLSLIEDNLRTFFLPFKYPERFVQSENIFKSTVKAYNESNKIIHMTIIGMGSLIFRPKENVSEQLGGPIKIGYFMKKVTESGFSAGFLEGIRYFLQIVSYISLALAFFNLLPFPALDGGYILIGIYEMITGRAVRLKHIGIINFIGFAVLITFALVVAFMDIQFIGKVIK